MNKNSYKDIGNIVYELKNPNRILLRSEESKSLLILVEDANSYLWSNLITKYFNNYKNQKLKNISQKDFYVLLYFSEQMGILIFDFFLKKSQDLLNLLPKIYDGDHLCILNGIVNTAITSKKNNVLMYRETIPTKNINYIQYDINFKKITYGGGNLKMLYCSNIDCDQYVSKIAISEQIYSSCECSDLLYGLYNPNKN